MTTTTKTLKKAAKRKITLVQAMATIDRLRQEIAVLEARPVRDRGPASKRTMTEADAREILLGKRKGDSHRLCAEQLGLSYGQVYSARNGFTFKPVYKEFRDNEAKVQFKAAAKAAKK